MRGVAVMNFYVYWNGFFENNIKPFERKQDAQNYARSLKSLKHITGIRIKEVR